MHHVYIEILNNNFMCYLYMMLNSYKSLFWCIVWIFGWLDDYGLFWQLQIILYPNCAQCSLGYMKYPCTETLVASVLLLYYMKSHWILKIVFLCGVCSFVNSFFFNALTDHAPVRFSELCLLLESFCHSLWDIIR